MDGEIGGLGGGRRADLVLLDDDLKPQNTWYGGELVVEEPQDHARARCRRSPTATAIPKAAYRTVKLPKPS